MSLELRIEKVAHGGVFVARPEGKVALVSGAIDGELVRAEVVEEAKSFVRAEVIEVLEPSEHRIEHIWPAAAKGAGGADFGHIALQHQRSLKSQVLTEALDRMAGLHWQGEVSAADESGLGYRRRIQLHANKHGRLGVKRQRSDEIIPIGKHPLAAAEINESGIFTKRFSDGNRVEVALDDMGNLSESVNGKAASAQLSYQALTRRFSLSGSTFWQAHKAAPELLAGEVLRQLEELGGADQVLDLYSGAGLFAANIAEHFDASVTAVESSASAVSDGKRSAADLRKLSFIKSDVLQFLRHQQEIPETLVLDPPRSGAATKVTSEIVRLRPKRIVYVACDPVALARDLKQFAAAGYELTRLSAFDIFPQTHHFETVVSLRLARV